MKDTVVLKFFADDAGLGMGLSHIETYNEDNQFNSFWNSVGIFHDVFEHNFELRHKYFMGDNGMNVGGEIAAMAHCYHYCYNHDLQYLRGNGTYLDRSNIIGQTVSDIHEAVRYGYCYYGWTLNCGVPYIKPADEYFENHIYDYWLEATSDDKFKVVTTDENEREGALEYKKSVTLSKIQRLHRWGYRRANKMFPKDYGVNKMFYNFFEVWNKITSRSSEELAADFDRVIFKLKFGLNPEWKAYFVERNTDKKINCLKLI